MELDPGIFASKCGDETWEPDDEVGGMMALLCDVEGVEAGFSRFADAVGPVSWTLPSRETLIVLEGAAKIEIAGGPTLTLEAGDSASLPAGAETTWHLTTPFREFWVLSR